MIQVNRIYLIFNRLVTKKFLVDTSEIVYRMNIRFKKETIKAYSFATKVGRTDHIPGKCLYHT